MKTRNTMRLYFSIISCVLFLFLGCKDTSSTINPDDTIVNDSTFTDIRDGRIYGIEKINSQIWKSENLDASTYRNGIPIRHASTKEDWLDAAIKGQGAWCYYNYDPKNGEIYGKLYNWYAVHDPRGLAPQGYHVPSDMEWNLLSEYLGGAEIAGFKMKSTNGWANGGNGDNSSGFNGLPGGYCNNLGYFGYITESGYWWSSSEFDMGVAWSRGLGNNFTNVSRECSNEYNGLSVRCIKD